MGISQLNHTKLKHLKLTLKNFGIKVPHTWDYYLIPKSFKTDSILHVAKSLHLISALGQGVTVYLVQQIRQVTMTESWSDKCMAIVQTTEFIYTKLGGLGQPLHVAST